MNRWHLAHLSVRKRLLFNNFIMVLVPLLLLVISSTVIFVGLRATGNFRDREIELVWPEAGDSAAIQLGLSHLRAHVDWKWKNKSGAATIHRHVATLERAGIQVAVLDDGETTYETVPDSAKSLLAKSYELAPQQGNAFIWDEQGLVFRYLSEEQQSTTVAIGPLPFQVNRGYFPDSIEHILGDIAVVAMIIAALVIVLTGMFLAWNLSHKILTPLEELRRSAKRIVNGDYETPVRVYSSDELGETATVFESMRQQLQQNRQLRMVYEKNRQELLVGIAHDLATPLTKITGYTSGLLEGIADTPEKQRHYLELVRRTSLSMDQLVQNLFLFSKLELGKVVFQWQIVDLAELLNEFVDSQSYVLAEQGFQLTCRVDASLVEPILVRIDPTQFRRVLDNILSNSIKYKEEGSDGWLNINLHIQGNAYQIEFTDGGRGVSSEELSRLFETFYRTDKARSAAAKGNGLGLAVTKKIIEGMQGEVWAEAARPKGLKICITLPRLSPESYL